MNKISLKMKLALGFGSLLVILAMVAGTGYYATSRMEEANATAVFNLKKANLSQSMESGIEKETTGVRGFMLGGKEDLLKHDEEGQKQFKDSADQVEKMLVTEKGKKYFADISAEHREFRAFCDKEIELRRAGKTAEAIALVFSPEVAESRKSSPRKPGQSG